VGLSRKVATIAALAVSMLVAFVGAWALYLQPQPGTSTGMLFVWLAAITVGTAAQCVVMVVNGRFMMRYMTLFALVVTLVLSALFVWSVLDAPRVAAMPYPNGPSFMAGFAAGLILPVTAAFVAIASLIYIAFLGWSVWRPRVD
jgi:hypothetical protein